MDVRSTDELPVQPEDPALESSREGRISSIANALRTLSADTANAPEGARYAAHASDHFRYVAQVLTNGVVQVEIMGVPVEKAQIEEIASRFAEIAPETADEILQQVKANPRSIDVYHGDDSLYFAEGKKGNAFNCSLSLSFTDHTQLDKQIAFIESLVCRSPKDDQEKDIPDVPTDLNQTLDMLTRIREQAIAEKRIEQKLADSVSEHIVSYQNEHPRNKMLDEQIPEAEVVRHIQECADDNLRGIIVNEELSVFKSLVELAKKKGITHFIVEGIEIPADTLFDRSFWDDGLPRVQEALEAKGYELLHNMKSPISLENNINHGVSSTRTYTEAQEKEDILGPYLSSLDGRDAVLAFTMLAVPHDMYSHGSHQGGDFAQARIPLTDAIGIKTIFFPYDTGHPDTTTDLKDLHATSQRAQKVLDIHAAKLLFALRHVKYGLIEHVTGKPVQVGDFGIIEGNTMGGLAIDPSTCIQLRLNTSGIYADKVEEVKQRVEEKGIPCTTDFGS